MSLAFCIHLVRNGAISSDQLVNALEEQVASRPQLGQLALQDGQLSMSQLFEILSVQRLENKQFGEIAIEREFLTKSQLALLLLKQSEAEASLLDVLIGQGAVSPQAITEFHEQWKRENRRRETIVGGRAYPAAKPKSLAIA
jgi:hypothetical protein